jgi:hypothetical protein
VTISREARAVIDYVESHAIPYRVTSIVRRAAEGKRPRSYHEQKGTGGDGLAVDFAGVTPGVTPTTVAQMGAIYRALREVAPQLAELIHNGPGISKAVKNGKLVDGLATFGPVTWGDHRDHVHVAVPRGTFLTPKTVTPPGYLVEEVAPMWDPPLQVVDVLPWWKGGGGGYLLLADGGVGAVGEAPYRGADKQPLGHDYWTGRSPARIERLGPDGYRVLATSGEVYEYP